MTRRGPSARDGWALCIGGFCLVGSGCGASFDPGSELDGLRVLAVKKSAPYAQPGSSVELEMLWHDTDAGRPPPQIAWFALCQNPPGDLFEGCFSGLGAGSSSALEGRISLPDPASSAANDRFSFATSPEVIASRPPPKDPATAAYGLDYVLFAACAGTLGVRGAELADGAARGESAAFPFVCYREQDGQEGFSSGDEVLASRDFVVGYTSVFAYAEFQNQNPVISGFTFNGLDLRPGEPPRAVDGGPLDAAPLSADDLCIGSACTSAPPTGDPGACPELLRLPPCSGSCEQVPVAPVVDAASAEVDEAASHLRSSVLLEQMWVNYYAAGGEISEEVRLLNDATLGWNDDYGSAYAPSEEPRVAYIWAVAHDNRGGAEWARLRVCVR